MDNGTPDKQIVIKNYILTLTGGMRPMAHMRVQIKEAVYENSSVGDGQYDAFMKALWKIYDDVGKEKPVLTDYRVTIPPGGKTDALVETIIKWDFKGHTITTKGLDGDQTVAALKATEKMLNIIEQY